MSDPSSPRRSRRKLAWVGGTGIVLGVLGYLLTVAVENVNESAEKSSCNLGGVAAAFHHYQDSHGHLPPAVVYSEEGKPLFSWRVLLLPWMDQGELYKEFQLDEPWDSPHNILLLPRMPRNYQPRGLKKDTIPAHHTTLKVFVGKGTPFEETRKLKISNSDERTILFVEAGDPVPWTMPCDLPYDPDRPLPNLRSLFRDGFRSCLVGGSYHIVRYDTSEAALRDLITKKGLNSPGADW